MRGKLSSPPPRARLGIGHGHVFLWREKCQTAFVIGINGSGGPGLHPPFVLLIPVLDKRQDILVVEGGAIARCGFLAVSIAAIAQAQLINSFAVIGIRSWIGKSAAIGAHAVGSVARFPLHQIEISLPQAAITHAYLVHGLVRSALLVVKTHLKWRGLFKRAQHTFSQIGEVFIVAVEVVPGKAGRESKFLIFKIGAGISSGNMAGRDPRGGIRARSQMGRPGIAIAFCQ